MELTQTTPLVCIVTPCPCIVWMLGGVTGGITIIIITIIIIIIWMTGTDLR